MRIRLFKGGLFTLVTFISLSARALSGTHAPAISTYDTRASSIVFAYRHGSSDAGPFNTYSYNANFTSTTGKLSAQFGIHYVNFNPTNGDSKAHGVGASGVGLLVFPIAGRWEDGVPKAALALDLGVVPTAYISGQRNFLTLPFVFGFGVPLSPARSVTFTPWFELAPSLNLDTVFHSADINVDPNSVTYDPATGKASLTQSAVQSAVRQGVSVDFKLAVPMRSGLEAALHVSPNVDLNLYASIATLGGGFSGDSIFSLGAGFLFRWDDVVPAVLPVERRLDREGCDAIEGRFRSCPNSRRWLSPEQRSRQGATPVPASSFNAAPLGGSQPIATEPASFARPIAAPPRPPAAVSSPSPPSSPPPSRGTSSVIAPSPASNHSTASAAFPAVP